MSFPMPKKVPAPGFYYHYKHDPVGPINNYAYEFVGVGFHTEESRQPGEEHFAVYRPLYEASVYKASQELGLPCFDARPLEMWMGEVEKGGVKVPRLQRITDSEVISKLEKIKNEMYK